MRKHKEITISLPLSRVISVARACMKHLSESSQLGESGTFRTPPNVRYVQKMVNHIKEETNKKTFHPGKLFKPDEDANVVFKILQKVIADNIPEDIPASQWPKGTIIQRIEQLSQSDSAGGEIFSELSYAVLSLAQKFQRAQNSANNITTSDITIFLDEEGTSKIFGPTLSLLLFRENDHLSVIEFYDAINSVNTELYTLLTENKEIPEILTKNYDNCYQQNSLLLLNEINKKKFIQLKDEFAELEEIMEEKLSILRTKNDILQREQQDFKTTHLKQKKQQQILDHWNSHFDTRHKSYSHDLEKLNALFKDLAKINTVLTELNNGTDIGILEKEKRMVDYFKEASITSAPSETQSETIVSESDNEIFTPSGSSEAKDTTSNRVHCVPSEDSEATVRAEGNSQQAVNSENKIQISSAHLFWSLPQSVTVGEKTINRRNSI